MHTAVQRQVGVQYHRRTDRRGWSGATVPAAGLRLICRNRCLDGRARTGGLTATSATDTAAGTAARSSSSVDAGTTWCRDDTAAAVGAADGSRPDDDGVHLVTAPVQPHVHDRRVRVLDASPAVAAGQ